MSRPFEEIDHSGDIGIRASGDDLSELLAHATQGLFSLLCRGRVDRRVTRRIRVESASIEDLVVDWLSEVIALGGARGELYGFVEILEAGDYYAEGALAGERFDSSKHDLRFDVKAATYHGLKVEKTADGLSACVIFDL